MPKHCTTTSIHSNPVRGLRSHLPLLTSDEIPPLKEEWFQKLCSEQASQESENSTEPLSSQSPFSNISVETMQIPQTLTMTLNSSLWNPSLSESIPTSAIVTGPRPTKTLATRIPISAQWDAEPCLVMTDMDLDIVESDEAITFRTPLFSPNLGLNTELLSENAIRQILKDSGWHLKTLSSSQNKDSSRDSM